MFLNPFFHLNPMSALTHTCENSVKCPMAKWSWTGQGAMLKKCKSRKPSGVIFFFIFSIICRFLSVLKCLLSMFWEVVMKKMEWIYLNQGENVGVSHCYVFALLASHWFIFQTSTYMQSINNHIKFDLCVVQYGVAMPPHK